jgi:hypothetical protein
MSLEDASFVAQIVAAAAVVVSLIYVGVQIRQNTRATKLAAVQAVEEAIGRTEQLIISDGSFAEALKHGMAATAAELSDTDRIRLNVFYRHALRAFQSAHYQYRHSALDESVWGPQAKSLAAIFQADRGLREHFAVEKYMLDPSFVEVCEGLLTSNSGLSITSGPKPLSKDA